MKNDDDHIRVELAHITLFSFGNFFVRDMFLFLLTNTCAKVYRKVVSNCCELIFQLLSLDFNAKNNFEKRTFSATSQC